jgi:hypothetical protein
MKKNTWEILKTVIYQWHFYFLRIISFLLVLKGQCFCEKRRYVPLPLPLTGRGCGGLLRLASLGRRKKRILDPGTLKKIKIPLIDY